jgi:hypothetical protein
MRQSKTSDAVANFAANKLPCSGSKCPQAENNFIGCIFWLFPEHGAHLQYLLFLFVKNL